MHWTYTKALAAKTVAITLKDVFPEKWSERLARLLIVIATLFFAWLFAGSEAEGGRLLDEALRSLKYGAYAIGFAVIIGILINGLIRAPFQMWHETQERLSATPSTEAQFDVKIWNENNVLQLYQAACLWAEVPPPALASDPIPYAAAPILQQMKDGLHDGTLDLWDDEDGEKRKMLFIRPFANFSKTFGGLPQPVQIPNSTEVDREGLRRFAEACGQRPKFLYS